MYWACETQGSIFLVLRSESSRGKCAKLHTVTASNNRDHAMRSLYYCLFTPHIFVCCSSRASRSWRIAHFIQRQMEGCKNIPYYLQEPHWSHVLFVKVVPGTEFTSWPQHHFVAIGNPEWQVCKATLWQQATIEIIHRALSIIVFVPHIYGFCSSRTPCSWGNANSTRGCKTREVANSTRGCKTPTRSCKTYSKIELDLLKWLRVKETTKMQTAFTKNLDINNLQSNLLKQHWAPFSNLSGAIIEQVGCHFIAKKIHRKNVKFHLTRACKPMAQSDSTGLVTRLDQVMTRLWLDINNSGTSLQRRDKTTTIRRIHKIRKPIPVIQQLRVSYAPARKEPRVCHLPSFSAACTELISASAQFNQEKELV